MLRKKEKKAITSIISLLIGWPIGLDKFVEGQNEEGVKTILTWLLIIIGFIAGAALNEFEVLCCLHSSPKKIYLQHFILIFN